jgi:hypothetical protein
MEQSTSQLYFGYDPIHLNGKLKYKYNIHVYYPNPLSNSTSACHVIQFTYNSIKFYLIPLKCQYSEVDQIH